MVSHGDAWQVTVLLTFDRCAISGGAPRGPEFRGVNCNCLQSCGQSLLLRELIGLYSEGYWIRFRSKSSYSYDFGLSYYYAVETGLLSVQDLADLPRNERLSCSRGAKEEDSLDVLDPQALHNARRNWGRSSCPSRSAWGRSVAGADVGVRHLHELVATHHVLCHFDLRDVRAPLRRAQSSRSVTR